MPARCWTPPDSRASWRAPSGVCGATPARAERFGSNLPLIAAAADEYAYDLNESNRVVGEMFLPDTQSTFCGFTSRDGVTTDVTDLAPELGRITTLRAVNDAGVLVGTAENADQSVLSAVMLRPTCAADLNDDGAVDLLDFFAFFNAFDTTDPLADVDDNPGVDLGDFFAFLNSFDTGCGV